MRGRWSLWLFESSRLVLPIQFMCTLVRPKAKRRILTTSPVLHLDSWSLCRLPAIQYYLSAGHNNHINKGETEQSQASEGMFLCPRSFVGLLARAAIESCIDYPWQWHDDNNNTGAISILLPNHLPQCKFISATNAAIIANYVVVQQILVFCFQFPKYQRFAAAISILILHIFYGEEINCIWKQFKTHGAAVVRN